MKSSKYAGNVKLDLASHLSTNVLGREYRVLERLDGKLPLDFQQRVGHEILRAGVRGDKD